MKKKYEKPEVYSENVTMAFAQECCNPTPDGWNPACGDLPMGGAGCSWGRSNYAA